MIRTKTVRVINLVHFPYTIFIGGLVLVQFNLNEWLPLLTDSSEKCNICNNWFYRCGDWNINYIFSVACLWPSWQLLLLEVVCTLVLRFESHSCHSCLSIVFIFISYLFILSLAFDNSFLGGLCRLIVFASCQISKTYNLCFRGTFCPFLIVKIQRMYDNAVLSYIDCVTSDDVGIMNGE